MLLLMLEILAMQWKSHPGTKFGFPSSNAKTKVIEDKKLLFSLLVNVHHTVVRPTSMKMENAPLTKVCAQCF